MLERSNAMAHTQLNPVLINIRGKIGDLVFNRQNGGTVISKLPSFDGRESTEARKAIQQKFRQAVIYGKMVMADPATRALYADAAKEDHKPIFSLTVADFFNTPTVDEVDLTKYSGEVGSEIAVRASDDFDVVEVEVAISDTEGRPIENGSATKSSVDLGRWTYKATTRVAPETAIRVEVTATDRPGHTGTKTQERNKG
jgi:hypothetical protein